MRVLILGGYGMLGHKLYQVFTDHFDVYTTVRKTSDAPMWSNLFDDDRVIDGVDVLNVNVVRGVMEKVQPDVVVNCVGIIKQLREAHDPVPSIATNSLLPHQLSGLCREMSARLIHISTDCVFSGNSGGYTELDPPDPVDLYGRTKWLGEVVNEPHVLTVRTSIIGRELSGANALTEWFLSMSGPKVTGYSNAIFSGLPTISLARILVTVLNQYPEVHGLYHVSADPINKFRLLELIRDAYGLPIQIEPSPEPVIDRSLNSDRFRRAIQWSPNEWPELIKEMSSDTTPYGALRKQAF